MIFFPYLLLPHIPYFVDPGYPQFDLNSYVRHLDLLLTL